LRGKAAGQAGCKNTWGGERSNFFLRFNREHIAMGGQTWLHMLNDTVAHEVAHTVCQANPQLGKNHNNGWKRVCSLIGGNGQRCYTDADAPEAVAKQSPYLYTTNNGSEVRVSKIVHGKIQYKMASYRFKRGKGSIDRDSAFVYAPSATANELGHLKETEAVIPPITKAPKAKRPLTITPRTHTPKKMSNAEAIRIHIRAGATFEECIAYGVNVLGMKFALAKTYVKNNWNK
jgi:predicted SprT family Zn-dependent metalloprotease